MLVHSTRFGKIEVADTEVFRFPEGLPGFLDEHFFALLPYQPNSPFMFLQSATEPNLTFVLVEPFHFFPDYVLELSDDVAQGLGLNEQNQPLIFTVGRIPGKIEDMTVNLLAPIILNRKNGVGAQVVLEKTPYKTRHHLFSDDLKQHPAKGGE